METLDPHVIARVSAELSLLDAALGEHYPTRVVEAGDELPVPSLLVSFDRDEEGRDRILAVSFLPLPDDDLPSTNLLQFYVRLPFDVPSEHRGDVLQAATLVNAAMAVGHFAVRDDELYYRYVLASPSGRVVDADLLRDLLPLLEFHQQHFGDYLEGVAVGEVSTHALPRLLAADRS